MPPHRASTTNKGSRYHDTNTRVNPTLSFPLAENEEYSKHPTKETGLFQHDVKTLTHEWHTNIIIGPLGRRTTLTLPSTNTNSSTVDVHLHRNYPTIRRANAKLLSQREIVLGDRYCTNGRILNVLQGEMAHAVPSQTDVITSDEATTCHILAMRSMTVECGVLGSLAHLDCAAYECDLRSMLYEHVRHHAAVLLVPGKKVTVDVHIMGGFDDEDGLSIEISDHLLRCLAKFVEEPVLACKLDVRLRTCAISKLNDTGTECPIGRGLAMDLASGEVFLSTVHPDAAGPALDLRSCRIYGDRYDHLSLVHTSNQSGIVVNPFRFRKIENIDLLLELNDRTMLNVISTSPKVEKSNFCSNVRRNLRFLKTHDWSEVFGMLCNRPIVFARKQKDILVSDSCVPESSCVPGSLNKWMKV